MSKSDFKLKHDIESDTEWPKFAEFVAENITTSAQKAAIFDKLFITDGGLLARPNAVRRMYDPLFQPSAPNGFVDPKTRRICAMRVKANDRNTSGRAWLHYFHTLCEEWAPEPDPPTPTRKRSKQN
jgi:hypothetical protein